MGIHLESGPVIPSSIRTAPVSTGDAYKDVRAVRSDHSTTKVIVLRCSILRSKPVLNACCRYSNVSTQIGQRIVAGEGTRCNTWGIA